MHQFWNCSILGRVSTFLLLKYVFLNDFLTTKSFSGWTLFLNPLQKFLKNQKLSQKGLTIVKIHQFWNCSILRRVSTFLLLKYVFLNDFLTTKSFSGWTLFLNPLKKFLKNQKLSQKGLIIVKMHQFWNCSILRRVSTFLLLKYVFLNDFLTTKSFSGWTLFLNLLKKF